MRRTPFKRAHARRGGYSARPVGRITHDRPCAAVALAVIPAHRKVRKPQASESLEEFGSPSRH